MVMDLNYKDRKLAQAIIKEAKKTGSSRELQDLGNKLEDYHSVGRVRRFFGFSNKKAMDAEKVLKKMFDTSQFEELTGASEIKKASKILSESRIYIDDNYKVTVVGNYGTIPQAQEEDRQAFGQEPIYSGRVLAQGDAGQGQAPQVGVYVSATSAAVGAGMHEPQQQYGNASQAGLAVGGGGQQQAPQATSSRQEAGGQYGQAPTPPKSREGVMQRLPTKEELEKLAQQQVYHSQGTSAQGVYSGQSSPTPAQQQSAIIPAEPPSQYGPPSAAIAAASGKEAWDLNAAARGSTQQIYANPDDARQSGDVYDDLSLSKTPTSGHDASSTRAQRAAALGDPDPLRSLLHSNAAELRARNKDNPNFVQPGDNYHIVNPRTPADVAASVNAAKATQGGDINAIPPAVSALLSQGLPAPTAHGSMPAPKAGGQNYAGGAAGQQAQAGGVVKPVGSTAQRAAPGPQEQAQLARQAAAAAAARSGRGGGRGGSN